MKNGQLIIKKLRLGKTLKIKNGEMEKELVEKLKQDLEKEKSVLEKELKSFAKEDKNIEGNWDAKYPSKERGDLGEEADESQEYENLLSLEQNLELKLKDVNSALEKIANNKYGACEKCGKDIEEERLLAYPQGKLCISCNALLSA